MPPSIRIPARFRSLLAHLSKLKNLTHGGVVRALIDEPRFLPPSWKRTALLRHCRLVLLNEWGEASIGDCRLYVDPELGVVVNRA